jgi:hypothetical protein
METHPKLTEMMEKYHCLYVYSPRHAVFRLTVDELIDIVSDNWKFNRNVDPLHAEDIKRFLLKNSNKEIETAFFLNYEANEDGEMQFVIFDGWHRYTALCNIQKEYPENNPMANKLVIVNVRFEYTAGEISDIFGELNKAITLPDIFTDVARVGEKSHVLELCETVCSEYQARYPTHFSTSNEPNRPNTSRMLFISFLHKVCEQYRLTTPRHKAKLEEILTGMNLYVKAKPPTKVLKLSKAQIAKCEKTGLYMFTVSGEQLLRDYSSLG